MYVLGPQKSRIIVVEIYLLLTCLLNMLAIISQCVGRVIGSKILRMWRHSEDHIFLVFVQSYFGIEWVFFVFLFFLKIFGGHESFCGATDTPVLDFWWHLLWVSKPEWVLPYLSLVEAHVLHYTFPEIHLWGNTCWPLGGQHGSRAVLFHIPVRHWWDSKPGAIMPLLTVWDQADALPTELSRFGRIKCLNANSKLVSNFNF